MTGRSMGLIDQKAFAYNQKPLKRIPRICQLSEQQRYAMFTEPSFPPTHKRKKSGLATRDYTACIKMLSEKHI